MLCTRKLGYTRFRGWIQILEWIWPSLCDFEPLLGMFTQYGIKKVDITFTRDRKVQLLHFGNLGLLDFVLSIFGGGIDEQLSYDSSLNVWYSITRWG